MRLLELDEAGGVRFAKDLLEPSVRRYAILSHIWGADEEEVTYEDVINGNATTKPGIGSAKIRFCIQQAKKDGLSYFWVDTCCIIRDDEDELSLSIHSMFSWYSDAQRCYVYLDGLADRTELKLAWQDAFVSHRWFTRGWTLQELLAPTEVNFFSSSGAFLGTKTSLSYPIHCATDIPSKIIERGSLVGVSLDECQKWQRRRATRRPEDLVYSLFGLLDISMPIAYGEGLDKAQQRLQEAIAAAGAKSGPAERLVQERSTHIGLDGLPIAEFLSYSASVSTRQSSRVSDHSSEASARSPAIRRGLAARDISTDTRSEGHLRRLARRIRAARGETLMLGDDATVIALSKISQPSSAVLNCRILTWRRFVLAEMQMKALTLDAVLRHLSGSDTPTTFKAILDMLYESQTLRSQSSRRKQIRDLVGLEQLLDVMNVWTDELTSSSFDSPLTWAELTASKGRQLAVYKNAKALVSLDDLRHELRGYFGEPSLASFGVDDLDIASLRDIGDLHVEWTFNMAHHLRIRANGEPDQDVSSDDEVDREKGFGSRSSGHAMTLYIFWFDTTDLEWLATHLFPQIEAETFRVLTCEIIRSWSFLFHHRRTASHRRAQKAYRALHVPQFVADSLPAHVLERLKNGRLRTCGQILKAASGDRPDEIEKHLHPNLRKEVRRQHGQYSYEAFPHFGARIVDLREYMDSRKPKGLRQLWRDNRDSLSYYTFWAVIVFGLLSLGLALLSGVTGVVQAWASVKALNFSTDP